MANDKRKIQSSASLTPEAARAQRKKPSPQQSKSAGGAGASMSKKGVNQQVTSWFEHHQLVAVETLEKMLFAPASSLLTWLVVAVALTLPGVLYMTVDNLQQLTGHIQSSGQMTVFLNHQAEENEIDRLRLKLASTDFIQQVVYVSPEQALAEFKESSGLESGIEEAIAQLGENPLPAVLLVEPDLSTQQQRLVQWQQSLEQNPLVDSVQADLAWVARLQSILKLASQVAYVLSILLSLAIVLIIGNTIRLAIAAREDEIRVVKLVGGTEAFVRRPFLYTGLWFGLGGSILATILLLAVWLILKAPVAHLAELYGAQFTLHPFGLVPALLMIVVASILGLVGAWWSVQRHLSKIEP